MKQIGLALALVAAAGTGRADVVRMTDAAISQAIEFGKRARDLRTFEAWNVRVGNKGIYSPLVFIDTPWWRVAYAAWDASRRLLPFMASDVGDDLLKGGALHLGCDSYLSDNHDVVNVEHIVVMRGENVIPPLALESTTAQWSDDQGGRREGHGVSALFPADGLAPGNVIVVITSSGANKVSLTPKLLSGVR